MTEDEWRVCTNPRAIHDYHRMKKHPRRFRLLTVACLRMALPPDPVVTPVLDVVERYADGMASRADFLAARKQARQAVKAKHRHADLLRRATDDAMEGISSAIEVGRGKFGKGGKAAECGLVRCVFGNPYRPTAFDPKWLTPTVVALAGGIYAERAFDRMPILADALEEAGCDEAAILLHCRGTDPHVRGCWVVDALIGKG
jgi:hypothetical protein